VQNAGVGRHRWRPTRRRYSRRRSEGRTSSSRRRTRSGEKHRRRRARSPFPASLQDSSGHYPREKSPRVAVVDFLKRGRPTRARGWNLPSAPVGTITGATSLRVFLLDLLAISTRCRGQIRARKSSRLPRRDEWAIGMRKLRARVPPAEGKPFSSERGRDDQKGVWLEIPVGFLEDSTCRS